MKREFVSGMMLTLLMLGMLTLAINIQQVKASGTIYIRADGSVEGTTDISSADNITYTFTATIRDSIVIERNNTIVDGNGYAVLDVGAFRNYGFELASISNVTIRNTRVSYFRYGIYLNLASFVNISGNRIKQNRYFGVYLSSSSNNSISGNKIEWNGDGISSAGIELYSSDFNSISGNNITANDDGIDLEYSDFNTISGNNITDNSYGIYLYYSNHTSISGNNIARNYAGIYPEDSDFNSISGNNITDNDYGFYLYGSSNNTIYHNNFINNTDQVYLYDSVSIWDDGYPSGGNYWDDYTGTDSFSGPNQDQPGSDGIGDTPYVIDAENEDRYPLMSRWKGHVIIDQAVVSDARVDVSSEQAVAFHAKWSLSGSDVTEGTIYVNGTGYPLNSTGWISFKPVYDTVGKRAWTVTDVFSDYITAYEQAVDDPYIIWDRVQITLSAVDDTVAVDTTASITWTAVYLYDGADFDGTITLNDSLTKSTVGTYFYTTQSISGDTHGITAFESNTVAIAFLVDTDQDGIPDITDLDNDNDGVNDDEDVFPLDPTEWIDTDEDGTGNNADTDDDNDGVPDVDDAFPLDASESLDTDGDGIGNNADSDDDNDGIPDTWETENGLDPLNATDASLDPDGDGLTNLEEYQKDTDPNVSEIEAFSLWIVGVAALLIGTAAVATFFWRRRK